MSSKTIARNLFGVNICSLRKDELLEILAHTLRSQDSLSVFTPNAEMLCSASRDASLRALLNSSYLNIPDGIGVYLLSRLCKAPLPERTTGIDTAEALLALAQKRGYSVFLLGGRRGVAERAASALGSRYPGLVISGVHHGYFDKSNSSDENASIVRRINSTKPDILLVCFGFPLQERWIYENLSSLRSVRLALGLGGSLDVWSGDIRRAPVWMRNCGLEWLWRIIREPRRLKRIPTLLFPPRRLMTKRL